MKSSQFHIGTSGWNYKDWEGIFYPPELKQKDWLGHYYKFFDTVEINNTFYQLPRKEVFEKWYSSVPDSFLLIVKAGRFITHMKKLKEPENSVAQFLENVSCLGEKLGPVLFQLPPFWNINLDRLSQFLEYLTIQKIVPNLRASFELRNATWACENVYALFRRNNIALCFTDWPDLTISEPVTADFIYLRRHGPVELYASGYSDDRLQQDANRIRIWLDEGRDVFAYFNNDMGGFALRDALTLKRMVEE